MPNTVEPRKLQALKELSDFKFTIASCIKSMSCVYGIEIKLGYATNAGAPIHKMLVTLATIHDRHIGGKFTRGFLFTDNILLEVSQYSKALNDVKYDGPRNRVNDTIDDLLTRDFREQARRAYLATPMYDVSETYT